jgi:exonuclease SbcD
MIRFVHTADIHYGVENYGRIDPETGIHSRLLDFHRACNICIDYALDKEVDLFVFAGDAYKTAHPTPTQQRLLMQSLLRLYQAKIPVVIVVGNHDNALSFGKAHALEVFGQLPVDGFHVIAKPMTIRIETKHGPCQIVGIPWPSRATISLQHAYAYSSGPRIAEYLGEAVGAIIAHEAARLDPLIPSILVGHLTVSTGIFSGSEKRAIYGTDPVLMPSQLAIPPFDYVALGHLHRYQNLNPNGYPAVVYSGSLERVDFGERKEEKGFCIVTIPHKGDAVHEFIPIATRPFLQIEIKLTPHENQTEQILTHLKEYPLKNSIVKIIYHVPAGNRDEVDIAQIQQACAGVHFLVGIIPIRPTLFTTKRSFPITSEMSLQQIVETYIATHPELANKREVLLKRAIELTMDSDDTG